MSDIHHNLVIDSMKSAFQNSKYSDLNILCNGKTFKVHRIIVCPRSKFFAAACDGQFLEAKTSEIILEEEDLSTIERMLSYLYYLDYKDRGSSSTEEMASTVKRVIIDTDHENGTTDELVAPVEAIEIGVDDSDRGYTAASQSSQDDLERIHIQMMNNISVHALADKYDIPGLLALAECKFEALALSVWPHYDFPTIVTEIFSSTPSSVRGLRDIVTKICATNARDLLKMEGPSSSDMKEIGVLGFDVLRLATEKDDEDLERVSAENSKLRQKVLDAEQRSKQQKILLTKNMERWIQTLDHSFELATDIKRCRQCEYGEAVGTFYFERKREDHPSGSDLLNEGGGKLRLMLKCRKCRKEHLLY